MGGLGAIAVPALAQQTREEELATAQAAKATDLHPWAPSSAERRIEMITRLMVPRVGWYPFIGSVFPGGSVAAGPGYRSVFGGSGRFDAHVARSLKSFTAGEALVTLPDISTGRAQVGLLANWTDAPRVRFYGIGPASFERNETLLPYRTTTVGGSLRVNLAQFVAVGGTVGYLDVERAGAVPNGVAVPPVFSSSDVPGLGASPAFVRTHAFAQIDSRLSPDYATTGGLYRVDWSRYATASDEAYNFTRVDAEVVQLIPLLRENWVIALRALQSVTQTRSGNTVPYFLMPDLGGGSSLRGYPSWRFRDRSRTLVGAEYRWMANRFVEMALFADAGTVTSRLHGIRRSNLHTSYGVGGRLHSPAATMLRIDLASTSEGVGLVVAFGPSF
jgi:hypothetical protein